MIKSAFFLLASVSVFSLVAYGQDWPKHPELHKAHSQIVNAQVSLAQANDHEKSEFGGHRAKAQALLRQAQQEVEQAADWADSHKK